MAEKADRVVIAPTTLRVTAGKPRRFRAALVDLLPGATNVSRTAPAAPIETHDIFCALRVLMLQSLGFSDDIAHFLPSE